METYIMESEVMTLLGVDDVEHWKRAGLLASVDELCRSHYKRNLHNGDLNESFTLLTEAPFSPNVSMKPPHLTGREAVTRNHQLSDPQPKGDFVGISIVWGEQAKGAHVKRRHSEDFILPSEARTSGRQGDHSLQKQGVHKRPSRVWRPM